MDTILEISLGHTIFRVSGQDPAGRLSRVKTEDSNKRFTRLDQSTSYVLFSVFNYDTRSCSRRKPLGSVVEDVSLALVNSGLFGQTIKQNEDLVKTLEYRAIGRRPFLKKSSRNVQPTAISEDAAESVPMPSSHLHVAVREGHANSVRFLLETESIDVNAQDDSGNTSLHVALEAGQEVTNFFVQNRMMLGFDMP